MPGRREADPAIARLEISVGKLEVVCEQLAESLKQLQDYRLSFKLPCQDKPDNACLPIKELKGMSATKLQVYTLWGGAVGAVIFLVNLWNKHQELTLLVKNLLDKAK
jgi:hypothetical protein